MHFYSLGSSFHRNPCLWENSQFSYRQIFVFSQPGDKGRENGRAKQGGKAPLWTWQARLSSSRDELQGKTLPIESCHLFIFVPTKSLLWPLWTQPVLLIFSNISLSFLSVWPFHPNQIWASTFAPALNYILFSTVYKVLSSCWNDFKTLAHPLQAPVLLQLHPGASCCSRV